MRPPGSLVPPAAGPPCRQGSPEEPLRATAGKVRRAAKNFSQGRSFPFLSTLPTRGATEPYTLCMAFSLFLSTLPARGATAGRQGRRCHRRISIHAPREGSDAAALLTSGPDHEFLSTLPARGATVLAQLVLGAVIRISIHAPREGSDLFFLTMSFTFPLFLSTLPARGATGLYSRVRQGLHRISIHAPREGSDPGFPG